MPISGCHDLPLATFNLPSRNNLQNKPNSAATQNKKPKPLVQPLLRRHAWLAGPPANTCSHNNPQTKTKRTPLPEPCTRACFRQSAMETSQNMLYYVSFIQKFVIYFYQ